MSVPPVEYAERPGPSRAHGDPLGCRLTRIDHPTAFRGCRLGRSLLLGSLVAVALSISATSALAANGQITGLVTDPAGQPVAGLTVRAISSRSVIYTARTAADGRYAIVGLAPDAYQATDTYQVAFLAVASGLSFANSYFYDAGDPQFGGAVFVSAGQTTAGVDAQLEPPAQISGTVTDQQGHPLGGVGVNARGNGTPEYGFAVTDATGRYTVGSLAAGSYTVGVEIDSLNDPADHAYVAEYYNQKLANQQPDPVEIVAGGTTRGIDVVLHPAGQISGTVTDPQGAPLAGAAVEAIDGAGHAFGRGATTAPDGSYQIFNLEPGSYTVRFAAPWASDYLDSTFGSPVTVTAAATTGGIDARLAHRGLITGTVTDAGGHPLAGIIATLAPPGFAPIGGVRQRGSTTDAQGRYSIDLVLPGLYTVYFSGGSYVPQYYGGASTYAGATTVTVSPGTAATGVDARMQQGGTITGTVTDRLGAPLSALVEAEIPHGPIAGMTFTGPDGGYTLGNLAPGSYLVSFQALGLVPLAQYYDGRTSPGTADLVPVSAGPMTAGIDARLTGPLSLPDLPPGSTPASSSVGVIPGTLGVSRSGAVEVGLSCTGPSLCAGTASLSIARTVSTTARPGSRRVTVGTTRFRLAAGRRGSVRVRLNATGRSFLRRHAGRANATLTVASASGTHTTGARLRALR